MEPGLSRIRLRQIGIALIITLTGLMTICDRMTVAG